MTERNPDFKRDLWLDQNLLTRHCLGVAATGAGKSNFLNLQLKQQMMRGGGVIHIDGKNSKEAIIEFLNLARVHDRWQDVRIINIDDANISNTYNPLLRGDADELTTRVMALVPNAGGSSAFFRSQAESGLRSISGLVRDMGKEMTIKDLLLIMKFEGPLRWLLQNGPKDSAGYHQYKEFYETLQEEDRRNGNRILSERKMQFAFGDLIGKLNSYAGGHSSKVMNVYNPEVDLHQAMKENLLVYVGLPTLSKNEAAINFAKLFISDIKSAIGQIQNEPIKPSPTFMVYMDEFSSYAMPSLAPVFEQARSANVSLFPFIQTISSLKDQERGLSEDFANKILGNTWSKISFGLKDPESCKVMSEIAGEQKVENITKSLGENLGFASGQDDTSLIRAGSRGRTFSQSVSSDYEAIVRPETFATLQPGDAVFIGPAETVFLKVPHIQIPNLGGTEEEQLDFPRFNMPARPGLHMNDIYQKTHTSK